MENENEVVKCDDPFWTGCSEKAVWHRESNSKDRPDSPHHLCDGCYDAFIDVGRDIVLLYGGNVEPMYDPKNWNRQD